MSTIKSMQWWCQYNNRHRRPRTKYRIEASHWCERDMITRCCNNFQCRTNAMIPQDTGSKLETEREKFLLCAQPEHAPIETSPSPGLSRHESHKKHIALYFLVLWWTVCLTRTYFHRTLIGEAIEFGAGNAAEIAQYTHQLNSATVRLVWADV